LDGQKSISTNILISSNLQADWYNTVGLFSFSQNHQQIYLSLQYGKNTLDKSRLRRNCWNNMQKNMDLPILFILLMMVSPVQDLIAQAFLP